MKKALTIEFIGTFMLVLTVGLASNPIAVGAVLAALVYFGGYTSGAHYNPAVTLAVLLRGDTIKRETAWRYMAVQLLGGLAAALAFFVIKDGQYLKVAPGAGVGFGAALLVEIIYTFALASVVLHVATTPRVKDNDYYGLAIGLVVMAGAFSAGSISGAAFNPAVGWGPNLFHLSALGDNLDNLCLYLLGPGIGAILAAVLYRRTMEAPAPLWQFWRR